MADFLSSNSMLMLERAMNFQWTKQRAITDNVVNAETPDYKTKYVTFEEALRKNIWAAAQRGAPLASMREAIGSTAPKVRVAGDETARMDGNGVNVAEQQIELVRNAFQIQHVYRATVDSWPSAATCPVCSWPSADNNRRKGRFVWLFSAPSTSSAPASPPSTCGWT